MFRSLPLALGVVLTLAVQVHTVINGRGELKVKVHEVIPECAP